MTKRNIEHFKYTWLHKKAYLQLEKKLTGKNTLGGYLHDVDKLILYLFTPLHPKTIKKIHKKIARHHVAHSRTNYEQTVIDWECCRFTKSDKPETAYETLLNKHPECIEQIMPILEKWDLVPKE